MKFRIIASVLLIAMLAGLAALFSEDQPPRRAPTGTPDDAAFRGLNTN